MCLTSIEPIKIKTAEKPIICYKELVDGYSSHTWYYYKPFKRQEIVSVQPEMSAAHDGLHIVKRGYHSVIKFKKAGYNTNEVMIIPKGTNYVTGNDNGYSTTPPRDEVYCSETLIRMGHVKNPITWIAVFIYKLFNS